MDYLEIINLVKALEDPNEVIRSNAVKALGKTGSKAAIPGLLKALEDSDQFVRRVAKYALGKQPTANPTGIAGSSLL